MKSEERTLAQRLGLSTHISSLRLRLKDLHRGFPSPGADCLEDWLLDVANARGARIVTRANAPGTAFRPPSESDLPNEELVVAICQLQGLDRPQMLRAASQLVSRRSVDVRCLNLLAERERAGTVLAELARQALRVDSSHPAWSAILERFGGCARPREPILHWTRLASPEFEKGRCNAVRWRLTA